MQNGRVIPPAPDKSMLGMTKIKMGKENVEEVAGTPDEARTQSRNYKLQRNKFEAKEMDEKCPENSFVSKSTRKS